MSESYIYLDYAATAPLCEEALFAMQPYLVAGPNCGLVDANANTLYTPGRRAFAALEEARTTVARAIGVRSDEVIFTSGATEADNAAIIGIAHASADARHLFAKKRTPQVIISCIEHAAVRRPAEYLSRNGFRVDILPVTKGGFVSPEQLSETMTEDCVLVSVQLANSEIGAIQPVCELARVAHAQGALFHTDATQALGKMPLSLHSLGVDAASFSAHKVGGPKGVGFLYLKVRTPFDAFLLGGGQEAGRRSGTQNVAGAVGCAAAVRAACDTQAEDSARLRTLRDGLYASLSACPCVYPSVVVPAGSENYLPNIVNVCVDGLESSVSVLRFDAKGICISGGSACSSASLDPSLVLTSLGIPEDLALGEIRVSMGRYTTQADIDAFLSACTSVLGGLHV